MLNFAWLTGNRDNKRNPQYSWEATGELVEGYIDRDASFMYSMSFQFRMNDTVKRNFEVVDTKIMDSVPLTIKNTKDGNLISTISEIAQFHLREKHQKGASITFVTNDMTNYDTGQAGFPLLRLRLVVNKDMPGVTPETIFVNFPPARDGSTIRDNRITELFLNNVHSIHVFFDLDAMV